MAKVFATFDHSLTFGVRPGRPTHADCLSCDGKFALTWTGNEKAATLSNLDGSLPEECTGAATAAEHDAWVQLRPHHEG